VTSYSIPLPEGSCELWRRQLPEFELLIYEKPGHRPLQLLHFISVDRFGHTYSGSYTYAAKATILEVATAVVTECRLMVLNYHQGDKDYLVNEEGWRVV
jgi:hypothetical protein